MSREINLIRKRYCEDNFIRDEESVLFEFQFWSKPDSNPVFLITREGHIPITYELPRQDLENYSGYRAMSIPKSMQTDGESMRSKDLITAWVNRYTNLDLIPEDIGLTLPQSDRVSVVISPNSMRFKNSFYLSFL